eukprot:1191600-Prorocentrum_minimum.AAC.4
MSCLIPVCPGLLAAKWVGVCVGGCVCVCVCVCPPVVVWVCFGLGVFWFGCVFGRGVEARANNIKGTLSKPFLWRCTPRDLISCSPDLARIRMHCDYNDLARIST